jgi:hypothetical protein
MAVVIALHKIYVMLTLVILLPCDFVQRLHIMMDKA